MLRGVLCAALLLGIFAALTSEVSAQSAQTKANANARWSAFWTRFSSAVNKKDRKKVVTLASSNFFTAGGDTIHTFLEGVNWSELRASVRKGTMPHRSNDETIMRITRDKDLMFEYRNGKWKFWGQFENS